MFKNLSRASTAEDVEPIKVCDKKAIGKAVGKAKKVDTPEEAPREVAETAEDLIQQVDEVLGDEGPELTLACDVCEEKEEEEDVSEEGEPIAAAAAVACEPLPVEIHEFFSKLAIKV